MTSLKVATAPSGTISDAVERVRSDSTSRIDSRKGLSAYFQRRGVTLKYRNRYYGDDWSGVGPITWTPCRFGGEGPQFVCSVASNGVYCGRRVIKLYGAGQLFACRARVMNTRIEIKGLTQFETGADGARFGSRFRPRFSAVSS